VGTLRRRCSSWLFRPSRYLRSTLLCGILRLKHFSSFNAGLCRGRPRLRLGIASVTAGEASIGDSVNSDDVSGDPTSEGVVSPESEGVGMNWVSEKYDVGAEEKLWGNWPKFMSMLESIDEYP